MAGNMNTRTQDDLLTKLNFNFGHIFDLEIINCVASEMNWDETKSIGALQLLCGEVNMPSRTEETLSRDIEEPKPNTGNYVLNSVLDNEDVKKENNGFANNFDQDTVELLNRPYDSLSSPEKMSAVGSSVKSRQFDVEGSSLRSFERVNDTQQDKKRRCNSNKQKTCLSSNTVVDNIQYSIINGVKIMIIMRGCPGSGKSTLARSIIKSTLDDDFKQYIFSTDDFFVTVGRGQFTFNPTLLPKAHAWNQQRVLEAVRKGRSPIIVDNTNLELWEMKPYVSMAVTHGYLVELLEPFTAWRYNVGELSKKNIHNVSREHIKNMMDRFLKNINSATLLKRFNFQYNPSNMPPQFVKRVPGSHRPKSHRSRTRRQKVPKRVLGDLCPTTSESEKESETFLPDKSKLEYSHHKVAPQLTDISGFFDNFSEINTTSDISENVSKLDNSGFMANSTTPSVGADVRVTSPCLADIVGESCQLSSDESFENVCKIESPPRFPCPLSLDANCCQHINDFIKEGDCNSFNQEDTSKFEECQMLQYDKVHSGQLDTPITNYTDNCSLNNIGENMTYFKQPDIKLEQHIHSYLDAEQKNSHQLNDEIVKLHNLKLYEDNTIKFESGDANHERKSSPNDGDVFDETGRETHTKSQKSKLKENKSQLDQAEWENNVHFFDFPSSSIDNFTNTALNTSNDTFKISAIEKNYSFSNFQTGQENFDGLDKERNCNICINDNAINSSEVHTEIRGCDENSCSHETEGYDEYIISTEENSGSNKILEIRKFECLDEDKVFVGDLNTDCNEVQKLDTKLCNNCSTDQCISAKESPGFENFRKVNQCSLSPNVLKTTIKNNIFNLTDIEDIPTRKNESLDFVQESFEIIHNIADENFISEREEDRQSSSKIKDTNEHQPEIASTSAEPMAAPRNLDSCGQTIDFDTKDKNGVKTDVSEKILDDRSVEIEKIVVDKSKLDTNVEEKVCDWSSDDKLCTWDSSDNEDKPAPDKKVFTPRPARTSRRPLSVNRGTEDQNNFQPQPQFVPKELELWDTVENPLASWGENVTKLSMESVGSNTHHSDFMTLHKLNNGETVDLVKVIHSSREQQGARNKTCINYVARIPKRIMLDKSTMTNIEEQFSRGLEELSSVFPNISQEYLKEIYDYCNGDFIWTVDLIMEQGPQNSEHFIPLSVKSGEGGTRFDEKFKEDKAVNASPKKPPKKSRNKFASEESQELKKQLERNFVINDDYYSDHTLFLRNIRHPENLVQINPEEFQIPAEVHLDDFPSSSEDTSEEEGIDMKLDTEFVKKLCTLFDGPSLSVNDFGPTLKIPKSLAVQIYYLLMEQRQSLLEQEKQKMIKEDEAFAKQLEESSCATETVPNLREIMDMEMAMALCKTDQSQWKMESMETLAIKLSKNLLCDTFPNFPRDVLLDIFSAHNYSFNDTIEVLLASSDDAQVLEVMTPEVLREHNRRLLQNAIQENKNGTCQTETASQEDTKLSTENGSSLYQVYKDEANRHYNLRKQCLDKANDAFRRGLPQVASYYSQVATLHKKHMVDASEQATHHFFPNKLSSTTLDLHYMFVAEALSILDVFIDAHLKKLNQSANRKKVVYIITGRGQHSVGARSRIKPAVSSRLNQRKLSFIEVNEGFLKVILRRGTNNYTQ